MPKQRKRNQSGQKPSLTNLQNPPSRRDRRNRAVAIGIILALFFSLLVGALSVSPTSPASAKSVHIQNVDSELVDTDSDGIENNQDPDVDGDGIVNGEDPDIDGDGIENFDDADPIDTTDVDSNDPQKPIRPAGATSPIAQSLVWIIVAALAGVVALIALKLLRNSRK
ncbi:MAG: hypothetical protein RLY34_784 [Actinomycetota bacterium]